MIITWTEHWICWGCLEISWLHFGIDQVKIIARSNLMVNFITEVNFEDISGLIRRWWWWWRKWWWRYPYAGNYFTAELLFLLYSVICIYLTFMVGVSSVRTLHHIIVFYTLHIILQFHFIKNGLVLHTFTLWCVFSEFILNKSCVSHVLLVSWLLYIIGSVASWVEGWRLQYGYLKRKRYCAFSNLDSYWLFFIYFSAYIMFFFPWLDLLLLSKHIIFIHHEKH